ncbi:protein-arginine deiminase type-3 [Alligator sinensis]|uniref:protein-arginine deiminase n=1 Tax=Alligator sinensis TaxID=38654 RepID=A0A1U7SQL2_ALLSI|nr:protein-arginine deiminase type-3 [Alligator sinensis]XP_025072584.1 protein-arginine deiminase type-3 [Alligator sinensis]
MSQQRLIRLSTQHPTSAVYVLGTEISIDIYGSAPKDAMWFDARGSPGIDVYIVHTPQPMQMPTSEPRWPLGAEAEVVVTMGRPSDDVGDHKVRILYYGKDVQTPLQKTMLYLTCVEVSLEADTTRSGTVQKKATDKRNWTWGPGGQGAILLVNCDRDEPTSETMDNEDNSVQTCKDLRDMSLMVLRTRGPAAVFANHKLVLHVSGSDADKVGVFYAHSNELVEQHTHVLGPEKLFYVVEHACGEEEHTFYVEGLAFPDADFSGLVSFHTTMLDTSHKSLPETPIFTDTVVFRVAPWIMTPNTLQPLEIYVCSASDNTDFVEAISNLAQKTRCRLTICPELENKGDRWIQDEMEFGYVQAPHKTFPVVFDSPRNRELKDFPIQSILGPDFGYVTREPLNRGISSLDSFGNLEVSPPVKVKGKEYPLGRILIGSSFPRVGGRRMTKVVRDFLYAQRVQAPVELFTDWLSVGHVDEFLSFVPAHDRQGFRLLLASPSACYKLLKEKQEEGHGKAQMFEGQEKVPKKTIEEILADETLRKENDYFQSCIDWNRDILKQELGLSPKDIIDIPQLFNMKDKQAEAYFPDMVNMIVLGKDLGIPKPFGPIINGQCCLEKKVRSLLEPLGLTCTFINDYFTYHKLLGEVHCGTNVLRKPFSFKWWHVIP